MSSERRASRGPQDPAPRSLSLRAAIRDPSVAPRLGPPASASSPALPAAEPANMAAAAAPVYCICRQPYDVSQFMIECDACKD
ncbi:hypothetical protein Z043_124488, partial [Scleropages formosus]